MSGVIRSALALAVASTLAHTARADRFSLAGIAFGDGEATVRSKLAGYTFVDATFGDKDTKLLTSAKDDKDHVLVEFVDDRAVFVDRTTFYGSGEEPTVTGARQAVTAKFGSPTRTYFNPAYQFEWAYPPGAANVDALRSPPAHCDTGYGRVQAGGAGMGAEMLYPISASSGCGFGVQASATLDPNAMQLINTTTAMMFDPAALYAHLAEMRQRELKRQSDATRAAAGNKPAL